MIAAAPARYARPIRAVAASNFSVVTEPLIKLDQGLCGVFLVFCRKILAIAANLAPSHFERFGIACIARTRSSSRDVASP